MSLFQNQEPTPEKPRPRTIIQVIAQEAEWTSDQVKAPNRITMTAGTLWIYRCHSGIVPAIIVRLQRSMLRGIGRRARVPDKLLQVTALKGSPDLLSTG